MSISRPGLGLGGAWGFWEGLRRPIAAPRSVSTAAPVAPAAAGAAAPAAPAVGAQATAFAKDAAKQVAEGAKQATGAATTSSSAAATAARISGRLRWNNVLNQVTRRGTAMGNSAGVLGASFSPLGLLSPLGGAGSSATRQTDFVLVSARAALIYNGINSTIDVYRGHHHDVYGSMAAAAATGAIWRSTGARALSPASSARLLLVSRHTDLMVSPRLCPLQPASSPWSSRRAS